MPGLNSVLAAGLVASALAVSIAPVATAAPKVGGSYQSYALKTDGVGYMLTLDAGNKGVFKGNVQFHYQNGTMAAPIPVVVTQTKAKVRMKIDGKATIVGTVGEADASLDFPKCYQQLKFASKSNADETCLFQPVP